VPICLGYLQELLKTDQGASSSGSFPLENGIAVFITDGDLIQMHELRNAVPGFVDGLNSQDWDVMLIGTEWSTGANETILFNVPAGGRPQNAAALGLLVNVSATKRWAVLKTVLSQCITAGGFDPSPLFNEAGKLSLWFGAQKFAGTLEEGRIHKAVPIIHKVFTQLANHHPPLDYDHHELHGNLMKANIHGRMAFELKVEPNGAIMFRAWNDNNSPNCEMQCGPSQVDWMKVFYNHQVVFEAHNRPMP